MADKLLIKKKVMRKSIVMALLAGSLAYVAGSTLQRLSLNDMVLKSTTIVRGTVLPGSSAALRGALIYTHYQFSVMAVYKGTPGSTVDIAVPGGVLNGMQQPVAGAPVLVPGRDYVMFLWTSKTGLTQAIGLSQGIFTIANNAQGQAIASRGASTAVMVDAAGNPITDSDIQMPLTQLVSTIKTVLAGGGGQ